MRAEITEITVIFRPTDSFIVLKFFFIVPQKLKK